MDIKITVVNNTIKLFQKSKNLNYFKNWKNLQKLCQLSSEFKSKS